MKYHIHHVRYQAVMEMLNHRVQVMYEQWHNLIDQRDCGARMSYKAYLIKMLERDTPGDEVVLYALSLAWGMSITVLDCFNLTEHRIRHQRDLSDVHLCVLYNPTCTPAHFAACGK